MSLVFRTSQRAIELALKRLKDEGMVHPEAEFNPEADGDLRREVTYYDRDFMYRLGRTSAEEEIVDSALAMLEDHGIVAPRAAYDKEAFAGHRAEVRGKFEGTWTSLSPAMERLIYMLTSVRRPQNLIEFGSFWGYTLAFFAGPCVGPHAAYHAERIVGIDIDEGMTARAEVNFRKLGNSHNVELIGEDARTALERIHGPFDFVYIEAKSDETEGLYLALLRQVYDRLAPGAWVIAHDNLDWSFAGEVAEYLAYVRDPGRFSRSVSFEIDSCGLELSIR
jgi:predicted O-methyltransferase YrrM